MLYHGVGLSHTTLHQEYSSAMDMQGPLISFTGLDGDARALQHVLQQHSGEAAVLVHDTVYRLPDPFHERV